MPLYSMIELRAEVDWPGPEENLKEKLSVPGGPALPAEHAMVWGASDHWAPSPPASPNWQQFRDYAPADSVV